jgi:hypothetical protein
MVFYDFLVAGRHAAAVTGYFDHLETFYLILVSMPQVGNKRQTFIGVCAPECCFLKVSELAHPRQTDIEVFHYLSLARSLDLF